MALFWNLQSYGTDTAHDFIEILYFSLKIFPDCPIYTVRSLKMSHTEVIKVAAIEPLGSIMTVQAQPLQQRTVQRTEPVSTEANPTETQVNNIDPTTVSVAAATDASENNSENTGSNQKDEGNNSSNSYNYAENAKQQNEKIKKAVEQLNKNLSHSSAIFGIHEATNRVTIKIVDKDTKEVIKELPPEKTLDMIAKVWEIAGILVDEKR